MWYRPVITLAGAALALLFAAPVAFGQWPTTCVALNDIVEAHLGNDQNVGIYQRVFGAGAEAACQNDHRDDVQATFAWAVGTTPQPDLPTPPATASAEPQEPIYETTRAQLVEEGLWDPYSNECSPYVLRVHGVCSSPSTPRTGGSAFAQEFGPGRYRFEFACAGFTPRPLLRDPGSIRVSWADRSETSRGWRIPVGNEVKPKFDCQGDDLEANIHWNSGRGIIITNSWTLYISTDDYSSEAFRLRVFFVRDLPEVP